jgi:single-stranded DNA-binding protein
VAPPPLWLRVTCWEATAEALADTFHKDSVYLAGKLTHNTWEAAEGQSHCGLNMSGCRCEVHGDIGKQAPRS